MSDDIRKRIDEIAKRCEQATPGPWIRRYKGGVHELSPHERFEYNLALVDNKANAELIAHSREDMPFLTDLVRRQDSKITGLAAYIAKLHKEFALARNSRNYYKALCEELVGRLAELRSSDDF